MKNNISNNRIHQNIFNNMQHDYNKSNDINNTNGNSINKMDQLSCINCNNNDNNINKHNHNYNANVNTHEDDHDYFNDYQILRSNTEIICRFCGINGHIQKNCWFEP